MLIDDFLPRFDFRESHAIAIRAPSAVILDCAQRQSAQDDLLIRLAIRLRETPARWLGRSNRPPLDLGDFTFLGRAADKSLAFGLVGAFWQSDYGLVAVRSPDAFRRIDNHDVCQLVMGFDVQTNGRGDSILTTETRVFCPTPAVWRKFAPYWYLIRPVSGLIRRRMLARIRREAESTERSIERQP